MSQPQTYTPTGHTPPGPRTIGRTHTPALLGRVRHGAAQAGIQDTAQASEVVAVAGAGSLVSAPDASSFLVASDASPLVMPAAAKVCLTPDPSRRYPDLFPGAFGRDPDAVQRVDRRLRIRRAGVGLVVVLAPDSHRRPFSIPRSPASGSASGDLSQDQTGIGARTCSVLERC